MVPVIKIKAPVFTTGPFVGTRATNLVGVLVTSDMPSLIPLTSSLLDEQ